jgi:histidinol-phosphate/aromatic aminotransferase/cobyric acid decarboxylase-like protein
MLGIEPDEVLDLSASLNPFAPDVAARVASAARSITRYPDVEPARAALAEAVGVDEDRVLLTNGGAEAIALVAAARPAGRVDEPDFSLYARHLRDLSADAPRWRSNPHNPTGRLAGPGDRAGVWDEAFYPLATGTWTRGDAGAFVVGSCTKVFACPGLRMGYVIAPDRASAADVRAYQPEWSVGALACEVLPALLADADLPGWAAGIASLRRDLVGALADAGLEADPSDASYVLVREAPGLREHLARRAVLVRDTSSFGIARGVRIAVPSPAHLGRLADALGGWRC